MRARALFLLLSVAGAAGAQSQSPASTPKAAPPAATGADEIDLLPPEKPPDAAELARQKEINDKIRRRRTMLQLHQLAGFATLASLTVAVTLGQLTEKPFRLDTATLHKAAMTIAALGYASQIVLGILAARSEGAQASPAARLRQRDFALAHQIIGYTTFAAAAGGFLVLTF